MHHACQIHDVVLSDKFFFQLFLSEHNRRDLFPRVQSNDETQQTVKSLKITKLHKASIISSSSAKSSTMTYKENECEILFRSLKKIAESYFCFTSTNTEFFLGLLYHMPKRKKCPKNEELVNNELTIFLKEQINNSNVKFLFPYISIQRPKHIDILINAIDDERVLQEMLLLLKIVWCLHNARTINDLKNDITNLCKIISSIFTFNEKKSSY